VKYIATSTNSISSIYSATKNYLFGQSKPATNPVESEDNLSLHSDTQSSLTNSDNNSIKSTTDPDPQDTSFITKGTYRYEFCTDNQALILT
jgi:hypothetical protein